MPADTDRIIKARKPTVRTPVVPEITERFSPRFFTGEPLPVDDIQTILEAARWAPSAHNAEPWFFYWIKNGSKSFQKLLTALPEFNSWAKTAGNLIVACYTEKNEKGINEFARYDLGAAVLSLILQATNLKYHARQMGIFNKESVKQIIKAKEFEVPFVIIALGKIGDYKNGIRWKVSGYFQLNLI